MGPPGQDRRRHRWHAQTGDVIATVNEDANSSLYTIDPDAPAGAQVTHYNYNEPLPHRAAPTPFPSTGGSS